MKYLVISFIISIFCSNVLACDGSVNNEFNPFVRLPKQLDEGCNYIFVYIPNKLNTSELADVTFIVSDSGEFSIPSRFVDASDLDDLTAKGFSLNQICASASKINKIKVQVTYYPPKGPNGEMAFCMVNREFLLSDIM